MPEYIAYCGASPTTAMFTALATGTAIKTLLQIATPSNRTIKVKRWGISFPSGTPAAAIQCELIETDVAATVTSLTPTLMTTLTGASLCVGGAALTGYSASAEGTITSTRLADAQWVSPTAQYVYQFVPGSEFVVNASKFLRVRVLAGTTQNAICFIHWEE